MRWLDNIVTLVEKNKKIIQLLLGIAVVLVIIASEAKAQTDHFIYGKVYTSSSTYQGQIRWGKEEAFWIDHFNASKIPSKDRYIISRDEKRDQWVIDWNISSIWADKSRGVTHQFSCHFGDIKILKRLGNERVELTLKNGEKIEVTGPGYNDIGTSIRLLDEEIGHLDIDWDRIEKIEFLPTPKLSKYYGQAMYGTVETIRKGSFTGLIQWDHDERLGNDKLDGDTRDGDVSINFDQIKSIERGRGGSQVILTSGREFFLTNSNDVDDSNRGIIVMNSEVGHIDIPWKAFKKVEYVAMPKGVSIDFESFEKTKGLSGTVYLFEGQPISGRIMYDIDEEWEFEALEGNDDEISYIIPFGNIKKIRPKNYDYSIVELRNGDELLLGGSRDVSDRNGGLLVSQSGEKEPRFIAWETVKEIIFD